MRVADACRTAFDFGARWYNGERTVVEGQVHFKHNASERERLQTRGKVVGALAGTKWGCDRRTLRATHLAYVQSKADYGLAAYAPFMAPSALHGRVFRG